MRIKQNGVFWRMENKNTIGASLLLVLLSWYGCTPLKEVVTYADASQQCLDKDNYTGYGHLHYCYDSCYTLNQTGKFLNNFDCDCGPSALLDTLIGNEYNALSAYFAALSKLAGSGSVMNFAPIAGAVTAGTYGSVTITANESKAVNALATVATDLLTTHYKTKKLKEIILRYNDTIKIALDLMKLHLDNLRSEIQTMSTRLKSRTDVLMAKASSDSERRADGERWPVVYIYKQKSLEWAGIISDYDRRYQSLDKIQKGHATLFAKVEDLRSESFKNSILGLTRDIIYISKH
jgi:hypothetical protein